MQVVKRVDGGILWANMHLLFWLTLVPFVTSWAGQTRFAPWLVELYRTVLLLAALGSDFKGRISLVIYLLAIPLAFVLSCVSCGLYVLVAIM